MESILKLFFFFRMKVAGCLRLGKTQVCKRKKNLQFVFLWGMLDLKLSTGYIQVSSYYRTCRSFLFFMFWCFWDQRRRAIREESVYISLVYVLHVFL